MTALWISIGLFSCAERQAITKSDEVYGSAPSTVLVSSVVGVKAEVLPEPTGKSSNKLRDHRIGFLLAGASLPPTETPSGRICEVRVLDGAQVQWRTLPVHVYQEIKGGRQSDSLAGFVSERGNVDCARLGCWVDMAPDSPCQRICSSVNVCVDEQTSP